jgi:hypothetical protein
VQLGVQDRTLVQTIAAVTALGPGSGLLIFPPGYTSFEIEVLDFLPVTSGALIGFVSLNSGVSYLSGASDYYLGQIYDSGTTTVTGATHQLAGNLYLAGVHNSGVVGQMSKIRVNPGSASSASVWMTESFVYNPTYGFILNNIYHRVNGVGRITHCSIYASVGAGTWNGTVRLWGLR